MARFKFSLCSPCLLLLGFAVTLVAAIPQDNVETLVNLRIEGPDTTIFEKPIWTKGHNITTKSGGTHHCDGTNKGAHPNPGPTCTSALDDASKAAHFPWDATYNSSFDDFLITSIDNISGSNNTYWETRVNYMYNLVGGCQQQVTTGDNILWAFVAQNNEYNPLKLEGPTTAIVNKPVTLTVTNGTSGTPIQGAEVAHQTSNAAGHVTLTFNETGLQSLKAQKADAIRSNRLDIQVKSAGVQHFLVAMTDVFRVLARGLGLSVTIET